MQAVGSDNPELEEDTPAARGCWDSAWRYSGTAGLFHGWLTWQCGWGTVVDDWGQALGLMARVGDR